MALQFGDSSYCKVIFFENGKVFTRRVTCIEVHRADGRVVRLSGRDLPDSICIQTGPASDSDGKGFVQVVEQPEQAFASATQAPPAGTSSVQVTVENNAGRTQHRFFTARDGFVFIAGMLATTVIVMLVVSAWLEVHDLLPRTTPTVTTQSYRSSRF
jgi:hypothetical protein